MPKAKTGYRVLIGFNIGGGPDDPGQRFEVGDVVSASKIGKDAGALLAARAIEAAEAPEPEPGEEGSDD